ncbi:MAG: helix-turn-helix domain-containing protein [Burkholderiales bacterium]|nr:helix-turn-helix domain-containing protein [Burkholderiales bacterium]
MSDLARNPKQLGTIIRRSRKRLGLSQSALGERVGLRQETISLIETGNPAARLDTILAVLAALDLELQIAMRSRKRDIEDLIG